ncbi:DedA family protein [Ectobacillus ponti]|uniref:DedA family protein n=1 Tax=Ectobacillus ponti TaxID=2961894 RepID=A0AA41XD43_9BACI|nr:DedA family protein [Ectobacillus ponti]MCP8970673.1 DedA family protein [Ectobacillus ponti]
MEHMLTHLLVHYGYFGIFGALVLGIVGLPLPDEVLLTYVGYNIFKGNMHYVPALLFAVLGTSIGITLSYGIGHWLGIAFLHKFGPKVHMTEKRVERTQRLFTKYGNRFLLVGYFIPGVRHVVAYLVGMGGVRLRTFMVYAYSGAVLWCVTFLTLGYQLGERWYLVHEYVHRYGLYAALLCVIAAAIIYLRVRKGTQAG